MNDADIDVLCFTCRCLNVELKASVADSEPLDSSQAIVTTATTSEDNLRNALGGKLLLLRNSRKRVVHEWLLRDQFGVRHCFACNSAVFIQLPDGVIVSDQCKRDRDWICAMRKHETFSECFQILVDPSVAHQQLAASLQEGGALLASDKDSLVPGHMEGIRLKLRQIIAQVIADRQREIDEEHLRALDRLRQLQSKCDIQCNTLLKIVEYQETAHERRFSSATTQSCASVSRSESTESKTSSLRCGGGALSLGTNNISASSRSPSARSPAVAGVSPGPRGGGGSLDDDDDDVFEMQFNDEAIYDDSEVERAEEVLDDEDPPAPTRRAGASRQPPGGSLTNRSPIAVSGNNAKPGANDDNGDDDEDDEGVSTASQERTRRSSMDLSQYATSLPVCVPSSSALSGHRGETRELSPAKPECIEDIARSMRDISDRLLDDHTKMFGALPRPRLYTNQF